MNIEDLEDRLGIDDFKYPESFVKAIKLNLLDFDLWYIIDEDEKIKIIHDFASVGYEQRK